MDRHHRAGRPCADGHLAEIDAGRVLQRPVPVESGRAATVGLPIVRCRERTSFRGPRSFAKPRVHGVTGDFAGVMSRNAASRESQTAGTSATRRYGQVDSLACAVFGRITCGSTTAVGLAVRFSISFGATPHPFAIPHLNYRSSSILT